MKRICVRGLIVKEDGLSVIFRRKNGEEYYVIPGGGVEDNETLEEALKRELKEELNIDVNVLEEVFKTENDDRIEHFFKCEFISGTFTLNGEELDRMSENNYYEPTFIKISDIDKYDLKEEVKKYFNESK